MVVAIVALLVGLGGGAYAAKLKLGKNAVKTKNIKNKAVTEAKIGDGAVTDSKLASSVRGAAAAWAHVNSDGSVSAGHNLATSNITSSNGFYCFHGVPEFGSISVTPDWTGDEFGSFAIATVSNPASGDIGCVSGSQFAVVTQFFNIATDNAPYNPRAFTIVLNK
jgi:hypothetical protein